ncbi:MAG: tetratricopeptide repeat protein [Thermodesulfobacteriota bacterium]|nr:tetratricopeptide repeat protein [Thermodesulfobacteriota bacterium]
MSPRVYWGATEKEIDDSSFVSPGKCPCTIPIDPKKATYLYFKNEYSTSFSDIPFALNINYFPGKIIDHGNSNMETAKEISFDEKKSFVLAPSGDHDWFSFTVSGPKDIFLKIDNLVDFSMRCYLKNADGDRIDRFHLSSNPEKNKFSIPKAGKYYLKFFFEYSSDSSHQEMDLSLIDDLSKLSAEAESGEEIDGDVETDEEKALDLARKAYAKLKEKQYGKSIELYEKALALDEKRTYWHDMGIAFFQQKQWKEAKRCFKEAVEMDSNYYLGHKSLGAAYGELKDYENSLKEFKLALTLTREDPLLYYNIARTYEAMYLEDQSRVDSLQNALSWSKKAFEKMPDDPKVSRQLLRIKKKMDIK